MNDQLELSACCTGLYEMPLTRLLLGSSFHPGGLALSERLARATALGPGDAVLDLAAGRGTTALHLAKKFGCHVTALDLSEAQVDEINQQARAEGLDARVSAVQGDATDLPFTCSAFDVVLCECALCTFSDRAAALGEARRVLGPGGILGLSDVTLSGSVPAKLDTLVGKVLCIAGALPQEGYVRALESSGFRKVRHRDVSEVLMQLVDQIETRLARLRGGLLSGEPSPELAELAAALPAQSSELDDVLGLPRGELETTLAAARSFVEAGGLGYSIVTGRC